MSTLLTIFTPAYNRAHLLPILFESLQKQTSNDFIWLIVDDGSVDETKKVVDQFIAQAHFEIRYIFQQNQGMHGAHNTAYSHIDTSLNVCIDSDDYMPINAVELITEKWRSITNQEQYAGIVGLDVDTNGQLIGTEFLTEETTLEDFYLSGGKGDKKLVYRTDIVNKYPPYPIFAGEKYVGLGYKYLLIDKDYKLKTLNEPLVIVDYQAGGSSNNMFRQYVNNPKGFAFYRKQSMIYSKSFKRRFWDAIHYVSSSLIAGNKRFVQESPKKVMTVVAIIPGMLLTWYIRRKVKTSSVQKSTEL